MKYAYHLVAAFCLCIVQLNAQIDTEMLKIPKEEEATTEKLSAYLTKDLADDSLKAQRIYKWITNNIAYDYDVIQSGKPLKYQTPAMVLKERTAVCQGYSVLMVDLLKKSGIEACTVEGYTTGVLSDSLLVAAESDHEWVAFRIKGKWYVCDPTWDAGYVGRLPKLKEDPLKKEKIAAKRKKKDTKASEKKKKKLKVRWEKADKKQEAKDEEKRGEYKNEVGFIVQATNDYFMPKPDEFVQTHLPSVPAFQLRDYPVTMEDFYKKTKTWDTILSRKHGTPQDYTTFANTFAQKKVHKQWITTAVEGFKFNPECYSGMAIHHFNYIGIHLDEKLQELHEDIEKSDLDESLAELNVINDSVLVYCKAAIQNNKWAMACTKRIMTKEAKIYTTTDKVPAATLNKAIAAQEKNIDFLKSEKESIEKNLTTILEKKAKVLNDAPNSENEFEFDEAFVPEEFQGFKDSIFESLMKIDELRASWDSLIHGDEVLDDRFSALERSYELSFFNLQILNSSPAYYDDTVVHYDSLMGKDFDQLLTFHKEIYPKLLYPDEIMREYKMLDGQLKKGLSRMKAYSQKNPNFKYFDAYRYWNSVHFQLLSMLEDDYYQSNQDRFELLYMEKDYQQYYEIMKKNLEEEKEFKQKNIDHRKELLEKDAQRMQTMYTNLKKNAQKLSVFFGEVLGDK